MTNGIKLNIDSHQLCKELSKETESCGDTTVCDNLEIYQGKIGLHFLICGANNVVEHYGERFKILHVCPFEG